MVHLGIINAEGGPLLLCDASLAPFWKGVQGNFSKRILGMNQSRIIPKALQEQVLAMPEFNYGVTRIRVILVDGSRFSDVFVAWGKEIVKVGTSETIPFEPCRTVAVERQ